MKKCFLLLLLATMSVSLWSQNITGTWNGMLDVRGAQLRLVFHIQKTDTGYTATMDSPDQGAKGIEVNSVDFSAPPKIGLNINKLRIEYIGKVLSDTLIEGVFKQAGMELPMNLVRHELATRPVVRKQDPKKPYPYRSEEVTFENSEAGITLAGTITIPNKPGKYPAVVLVTGSGPQNRDEELMGHRPFLVLSDYLTRKGIVVLRYDDRGVGSSTGNAELATTSDLAGDAIAAVDFLKAHPSADPEHIGIIGHSEGGMIAPMVANLNPDVKFIVLLAGPGVPCDQLLVKQMELIYRAGGAKEEEIEKQATLSREIFRLIKTEKDTARLRVMMTEYIASQASRLTKEMKEAGVTEKEFVEIQVSTFMSPWMLYFINYDPSIELSRVKCPVLALNGTKDLQVSAPENLQGITNALEKGGNQHATLKQYPKHNHMFQKCKTGHPDEYGTIRQTISPKVMKDLAKWINKL